MKRYKPYFNEDITIDFIPILNKVVKSYISKNRDNNFFTGDCANFAEALFKFVQYNEIIHNLKEDKDYYIVTMSDNSVSHTVLFIKGKYIDASGINTKNQIEDKFATGDGKVVWEKDEGIYNNSGVSSTKILNGLENEFEKFYPDLSSKLSEDITIPLSKGDTFFYGKFKNKQAIYASDYINDKGDPIIVTDTGKEIPMCKIRLIQENFNLEKFLLTWLHKGGRDFPQVYIKYILNKYPNAYYKGKGIRILKNIKDMEMYSLIPGSDNFNININKLKNKIKKDLYKYQSFSKTKRGIINVIKRRLLDPLKDDAIAIEAIVEGIDLTKLTPYLKDIELINFINDLEEIVAIAHSFKILGEVSHNKNNLFIPLNENLRIVDLQKHAGTSDFTYSFMKDRQKIKGAGNKSAKLVKIKVNKNKDWVTFVFLSEPTYTFNTKAVQLTTNDKRMKIDNLYTQQIRILNIFSLLKSNPNFKSFKEVTIKEIKEVLKSADVQVSCDDPSFWWQGDAWVLTQFDASIFPCDIEPKHWRKHHFDNNYVCKHLSLILNSIDFYIPIMAGMIYKYLNK